MTSDETLLTSRVDGVARIILDRPDVALAKAAFFARHAPEWEGR